MSSAFNLGVFILLALVSIAAPAQQPGRDAEIKQLFAKVNANGKGALGKNSYQRPNGRVEVLQDSSVSGAPRDTLFTAAFRNEFAQRLAQLDFYVGSRFSSNYWELHNRFLATDAERRALAFRMDHARFLATPEIAPVAQSMSRHMLMEAFYMRKFPATRLSRANMQRGTADAENEKTFYGKTVEYLARSMQTSADYLLLFEVQRRFNLTGDTGGVSLQSVRDTVASIYEGIEVNYAGTPLQAEFYSIRNAIHNYMTPDVLTRLNAFLSSYGTSLWGEDERRIRSLRDSIAAYYRIDKKVVLNAAKALGDRLPADVVNVLNTLADKGNSVDKLEQLTWVMTKAREQFVSSRDPEIIHWQIKALRFVAAELNGRALRAGDAWSARARLTLDGTYVAGLVSAADWSSARTVLSAVNPSDVESARAAHREMVRVIAASAVLARSALSPAIEDWAKIDRGMEGIVDDTLRASLLTELNQVASFVKSQLPAQAATKYVIENEGETYGFLTYVPKGSSSDAIGRLEPNSIPVFAELPLDLGVVAGIITEQPQTPLSHVNIKSKARGTPNMYYPNASQDPLLKDLIARKALVKMTMKDGQLAIREATLEEARQFWQRTRASGKIELKADLTEKRIRSTKELGSKDVLSVGAKSANYGEAARAVGDKIMLPALTVPFFYYKEFVEQTSYDGQITIAQRIKNLLADPLMKTDRNYRIEQLKALQKRMTADDVTVNPELVRELETKATAMYPGRTMRLRSSTNSEDLPNFSGAGLYDSFSYDPAKPKKSMAITLKKTWASVWTLRSYDEREHFGIDHSQVYMAILVSPGFPAELANGVAVTRNVTAPQLGAGYYINTQLGEEAVTNPNPALTPEELIVLLKPDAAAKLPYTLRYMKYSPLSQGRAILTPAEVVTLTKALAAIHKQMKAYFDPKDANKKFAVDVEWKIDDVNGARQLFIKQARPYVD